MTSLMNKAGLLLRNDGADGGPEVRGLRLETPRSCEEALSMYRTGMKLRKLGTSERNARSSRSHTVCCLYVRRFDPSTGECSLSKMSLVDLAGSERQSSSSAFDRTRVKEASHINQSLTTLGKVVQACIGREKALCHIPYRDSVLTQLLSDSIGGQAKTLMIVHVTPHQEDAQESGRTLQFAANAACVQERSAKGEEKQRQRLVRLSADNARLRGELQLLDRSRQGERTGSPRACGRASPEQSPKSRTRGELMSPCKENFTENKACRRTR